MLRACAARRCALLHLFAPRDRAYTRRRDHASSFASRRAGDVRRDVVARTEQILTRGVEAGEARDSDLLERARRGDSAAFAALIRRHDKYLYRVVRSVLADGHEAEDALQETYVRAFTRLGGFRGGAEFRTWLTRVALNEAVRRRRRMRATLELGALHAAQERSRRPLAAFADRGPDPERATARAQMRRILERAIDALPVAFRTVLVLRDVEEVSTKNTAQLLGLREETVKTRLHRARRILRETLGEQFAAALKDVFPFERPRCDELVRRVLAALKLPLRTNTLASTPSPKRPVRLSG